MPSRTSPAGQTQTPSCPGWCQHRAALPLNCPCTGPLSTQPPVSLSPTNCYPLSHTELVFHSHFPIWPKYWHVRLCQKSCLRLRYMAVSSPLVLGPSHPGPGGRSLLGHGLLLVSPCQRSQFPSCPTCAWKHPWGGSAPCFSQGLRRG